MIENGRTMGVLTVHQWTNVLFDLMLSGLFKLFGAEAAQRISISIVVLTFVWGAFAFVSVVSQKRPWHLMPCIAMLAYGWVFHMGFFSFYLSLGLCFWAMAFAWDWQPRRIAVAAVIFLLAYLAHALPVIWTLGSADLCGAGAWADALQPGLPDRGLRARTAGSARGDRPDDGFALVAGTVDVGHGLDQVWIFDSKYYIVLMGLLLVWGTLFLGLLRGAGARAVVAGIPFQLCILSAAAVSILPGTVLIPGFYHALEFPCGADVARRGGLRLRDVGRGASPGAGALGAGGGRDSVLRIFVPRRTDPQWLRGSDGEFDGFGSSDEYGCGSGPDAGSVSLSGACRGQQDHQIPHHQKRVPIGNPTN